ncbi:MAG: Hpt domain-containing protein [Betaproteobacteria bacterium]|nr:Hpt domain-containing protein [Betaproteobacteria bacterium]
MSTEPATDFDLGPLSWVQAEIDQALGRALETLATFKAKPDDAGTLKHARAHVHQAAGAIQMVGLDAVVAYTDEVERQLARLGELPAKAVGDGVDLVDRALQKLRIFLAELVNGTPPVPLRLYPEYEAMQLARGARAAAPTDLFYPDLSVRAPRVPLREAAPPQKLASQLIKQRRAYQHGLLAWLRGDAEGAREGARRMRDAISGIEDLSSQPGLRAFWWTAGALFEAIAEQGVEAGFGLKQLAARVDLQIRRVAEGGSKVADRMRREVLYYVAISAPVAPQVSAVQKAFGLAGLIPTAETIGTDVVRLQPLIREAREQLAGAKDTWLKFASGRAENLPKLKQTLTSVHSKAAQMKQGALMKLTAALVERLDKMPGSGVSEPVAMEYATGLLLAESAFENYANLTSDFPQQVDALVARLDAARAGRTPPGAGAPALDEMSRRAQERVLIAQVGREIQANLRHMEQVLDAFFRDHGKRGELASLAKDSAQIRGALRMLGLEDAEKLLALCQEQIESYADPEANVDDEDLELLAESLSGLGFYVEAVEQQRPDRERLIAPLIARRLGEPAAPAPQARDSVEEAVAELRAQLPELVDEMHAGHADEAMRASLRRKLASLRDDAELIGDAELAGQAESALREFDAGGKAALAAAVEAIAETSAPAPELSEETQRLLEVDAHGLDTELLDIYLTEAGEVIDAIRGNARSLDANPGDRDALANVRRGFHTLKGSGRMVGLAELGEFAWHAEKIHNRLLEEQRPVTAAVLRMIDVAASSFGEWVDALREHRRVTPDPRALHDAIRAVEAELPGNDSVLPSPPSPKILTQVAPPVADDVAGPAANEPVDLGPFAEPGQTRVEYEALPSVEHAAPRADEDEYAFAELGAGDEPAGVEVEVVDAGLQEQELPLRERAPLDADADFAGDDEARADVAAGFEVDELPALHATAPLAPQLKLVADNARPLVPTPPVGPPVFIVASAEEPEGEEAAADATAEAGADETTIGTVVLSTSLWRILVDEAAEHLATLDRELGVLQFDPQAVPSPAMIRASHTLCGIHRTAGFEPLAALAKALELALTALAQHGAPLPSSTQPLLAGAIATLRDLGADVAAHRATLPYLLQEARNAQEHLEALRQQATVDDGFDAESAAAHVAARDDEAQEAAPAPATSEAQPAAASAPQPTLPAFMPEPEVVLAAPEPVVDPLDGVRDEIEDPQVLEIFLDEAAELFPAAGEQLRTWRRAPHDMGAAQQLRRTLHTFKGSARMAGAMRLGQLTHVMESRLIEGDSLAPGTGALFEALDTDLDRLAYVLDRLRAGEANVALPWLAAPAAEHVSAAEPAQQATAPAPAPAVPVPDAPLAPAAPVAAPAAAEAPEAAPQALAAEAEGGTRAMLRVRAETIDRLVNEAGEVAIARARVESELRSLKANLLELTGSVIRLRTQVREIEIQAETQIHSAVTQMQEQHAGFDPLEFDRFTRFQELTRSLAEGVNDVSTVQQQLLRNLDDADAALLAQARLSRDVQQQLFAIRTVPFGSLAERLYRIVRAVAKELGKRANLEIVGGQTELDRSVLEKLVGPLEHLLRNAIDHGVESREARRAAGKPEAGEITLTVRQTGNEVAIELSDDGAGIDVGRVLEKARAAKLVAPEAQPTQGQLLELIFQPGFTTASRVTAISGRGVGMDVVRAEIVNLGGRVEVATEAGRGTQFTLSLPLTLAVAQAVLVRAGGRLWALPAPMVEQVQQVREEALLDLYVRGEVSWQGRTYPFHYLPRLLGDTAHQPDTQRYNAVLLVRSGHGVAAVHVDEMVGNQEIVVKNIGPQLARVSGISGATVLGTGEIVLILNPVQLAQRAGVAAFVPNAEARVGIASASAAIAPPPLVLIVDDSLTVRKITSRLLVREGFRVATARDGLDALQAVGNETPDVILLDIEMPRMDGFEFTKTLKSDPKHAHVPIIVITSRTADKHRARAAELGVDLYLGKPYQEEELLRNLREMLGMQEAAAH